jgi:nitrate/TMAO reductase-like tetraheme cytochrome c subunit
MVTEPRTLSPRKLFSFIKKLRLYESLLIALIVIVLLVWGVKETTESAVFCGNSCHVMRPHYDEWKVSSHHDVPCVECHLPPREDPQFYPDFRALGQVASYLTRTYRKYTRAEVEDTSCLRDGCHSRRLLEGRVTYAADITFNHTPHLQQLRRGKILHCTTCHARNVMGEHISVVHETCFICHLKGDRRRLYTAQCVLCHQAEKLSIKDAGGGFSHDPYLQRAVPCESCHDGVINGKGQLDEESCDRCHGPSGPDALRKPPETLHQIHVTDHKVECGICHQPIRHEMEDTAARISTDCNSCHISRHAGITNMYRGTGAVGVHTEQSPMFKAGVACVGCHRLSSSTVPSEPRLKGDTFVTIDKACSQCHGMDMSEQLERWNAGIAAAFKQTQNALKRAEVYVESLKDSGVHPDAELVLEKARHNILFVRASSPIHNSAYAVAILNRTAADLNGLLAAGTKR